MRVDRQVLGRQRAGVFEEGAREPVVLARPRQILDLLAEGAAEQLRPAGARRPDEADGEARLVRHRHERGLPVAREPLDAHARAVDRRVGLEVVDGAAGAPGPRPERAPVFEPARLAVVGEANDAPRQPRAVVGLDARGDELGVAPALLEEPLPPRRLGLRRRLERRVRRRPPPVVDHDRDGPVGVGWRHDRQVDRDLDGRIRRVVDAARQCLGEGRDAAVRRARLAQHLPGHLRHVVGDAPVHLAVEQPGDLGAADLPPLARGGHAPPGLRLERVGEDAVRLGLGLVGVGGVRVRRGARRAGTELRDPELVQHPPVVLFCRQLHRNRSNQGLGERGTGCKTHQENGEGGREAGEGTHAGRGGVGGDEGRAPTRHRRRTSRRVDSASPTRRRYTYTPADKRRPASSSPLHSTVRSPAPSTPSTSVRTRWPRAS